MLKGHSTACAVDTVGMQYAVDVSAKRSIHTVDLANMGGGGLLPLVQKGQNPGSGYSVRSIC